MAKNLVINEAVYSSVPNVAIPKADGSGDAIFYDTSDATISANDMRKNATAYGPNGVVTGNLDTVSGATVYLTAKAQEVSAPAGIHSGDYKVKLNTTDQNNLIGANLKKGVTVLGVAGEMTSVSVSQDSGTKALRIY